MNQIQQQRIGVIDALRAITLLGILLTHTAQMFCFDNEYNELTYLESSSIFHYILVLLSGKCKTIFCILFGVSFYFLLRNPNYSNRKFIWRCIILICFGLINKVFYTTEILMWYGLCGIILVFFRNIGYKKIIYSSICLYLIFIICKVYSFRIIEIPERDFYIRYLTDKSIIELMTYPLFDSILDYIYIMFPLGLLETMSLFLLGYYIGQAGYINNLSKYVTFKIVMLISGIYIGTTLIYHQLFLPYLFSLNSLIGALAYSIIFIYLYNNLGKSIYSLESYGKMGLTNYTLQNVCGVIFTSLFFIPLKISASIVLFCMILFYIIQLIFSSLWMNRHKFGPLEGLWRKITNVIN